ncbi:hypothetical protein PV689_21280 [Streptomyces sp. ATCC51928]|uniref:Lipoprotein n=1 Tax=Streptomyces caviscabies TaxID=90079 RepID=A0ABW2M8J0_9ACTN|nr:MULTISPECIES: hypothetical protein [unclassified Streptomyces]MDX3338673.1 hypothetical protein [Streptomyces sp. ME02-6979.5a]MDX3504456.1 hypothetical protein [Streptomyces sp. ATCC51928]MDX5519607.1 hypothetical protein [Streptomyces sp. DE06-01C]
MRGVLIGVVAAVAVLGVAGAVAVPEAKEWYDGRHEQTSSYATGKEAKKARESVPRWLPDDAASVEYAMRTTGGERILKATLRDGRLPAQCEPLGGKNAPDPEISASWFPSGTASSAQGRCGSYYVSLEDHTLYAWQTNGDWVAENRRSAQ